MQPASCGHLVTGLTDPRHECLICERRFMQWAHAHESSETTKYTFNYQTHANKQTFYGIRVDYNVT